MQIQHGGHLAQQNVDQIKGFTAFIAFLARKHLLRIRLGWEWNELFYKGARFPSLRGIQAGTGYQRPGRWCQGLCRTVWALSSLQHYSSTRLSFKKIKKKKKKTIMRSSENHKYSANVQPSFNHFRHGEKHYWFDKDPCSLVNPMDFGSNAFIGRYNWIIVLNDPGLKTH